jgi:hypothetical protein
MASPADRLRELQRAVFSALRTEAPVDHAPAAELVVADGRLDAPGRLGIYRTMYTARIVGVLRQVYPALVVLLGDDDFAGLAHAFVRRHPSRHPSLRYVAGPLPSYLAAAMDAESGSGSELPPWVAELATLEWHRYDLFDGPDVRPLTTTTLRGLSPAALAELPLRLPPTARQLRLTHAVDEVWRTLTQQPEAQPTPPERLPAPTTLLVWREGTAVFHRRPPPLEALALAQLASAVEGLPFLTLCEQVLERLDELPEPRPNDAELAPRLLELLLRWCDSELLQAPASGWGGS